MNNKFLMMLIGLVLGIVMTVILFKTTSIDPVPVSIISAGLAFVMLVLALRAERSG